LTRRYSADRWLLLRFRACITCAFTRAPEPCRQVAVLGVVERHRQQYKRAAVQGAMQAPHTRLLAWQARPAQPCRFID
jgi:hypothetical protein